MSSNLTPSAMNRILDLRKNLKKEAGDEAKKSRKKDVVVSAPIKKQVQKQISPQISWEAPSFYFNPQKRYFSLVIVALVLGGGAMLFFHRDTLTAIFLILSSLVLILYSNKRPEISKITIDQAGVKIGDMLYYYKDIKSFWIQYNPGEAKELSIESKKWYMPYVKISIEDKNPLSIRSLMINFLPEREHEKSIVDIVARKVGL